MITAYPVLAEQYLDDQGYVNPRIIRSQGKIEGQWAIYPDCYGVCDIEDSGRTRVDNQISVLAIIMQAQLAMYVNSDKTTATDVERLNNFRKALLNSRNRS